MSIVLIVRLSQSNGNRLRNLDLCMIATGAPHYPKVWLDWLKSDPQEGTMGG